MGAAPAHKLVLAELLRRRATTRTELTAATGLSAATVSRAIEIMLADRLVDEVSDLPTGVRGRNPVLLQVNGSSAQVAGIDMGASTTRIVIVDLLAEVLVRSQVATPAALSPTELGEWLAAQVRRAAPEGLRLDQVAVGLPGAVQPDGRRVRNAPNLPQVEDAAFMAALEAALGRAVDFDNDVNYALLGEQKFGAATRATTAAMMTVGTGLGAAVSVGRRLVRGRRGLVGEFGHLLVGPDGTRLESLVTGPMLSLRASELGVPIASPAELFGPDAPSKLATLVAQFDAALMIAVTALIVSVDPDVVILGGGISKSLAPRLAGYEAGIESNLGIRVPLVPAGLGDFAGAVGAAVAALHGVYRGLGVPEDLVPGLPGERPVESPSTAHEPPTELP